MSIYYYQLTGSREEVLERLRLHNVGDILWYEFDEENLEIWFGDRYLPSKEIQFQMEFVVVNKIEYLKVEQISWLHGKSLVPFWLDSFWEKKIGAVPQKTAPLLDTPKIKYEYVEGVPRKKKKNLLRNPTVKIMIVLLLFMRILMPIKIPVKYDCMQEPESMESINIYGVFDTSAENIDDGMMVYKTVKPSEYEVFIEGLEKLPFENEIWLLPVPTDPNFSHHGLVVKIVYNDGSYEMISSNGIQTQVDENGKRSYEHYSCDDATWFNYMSQYSFTNKNN